MVMDWWVPLCHKLPKREHLFKLIRMYIAFMLFPLDPGKWLPLLTLCFLWRGLVLSYICK